MRALALLLLAGCSTAVASSYEDAGQDAPATAQDGGPDGSNDAWTPPPPEDAGPPPTDAKVYSDDVNDWCNPGDCFCGEIYSYKGIVTCNDAGRWYLYECEPWSDGGPNCNSGGRGSCWCGP